MNKINAETLGKETFSSLLRKIKPQMNEEWSYNDRRRGSTFYVKSFITLNEKNTPDLDESLYGVWETNQYIYDGYTGDFNLDEIYELVKYAPKSSKDEAKSSKDEAKDQLISLLKNQVLQLTTWSKIELGDDVISEINRLQQIIEKQ
jgi:hypothetical protein